MITYLLPMEDRLAWPAIPATQSERTTAAVCHIAGIFAPYLAPLVFLALAGKSRFVRTHAMQSFFEALVLNIVLFVVMAISFLISLPGLLELIQTRGESFSWNMVWTFIIKSAVIWVALAIVSLVYIVLSILDARQAMNGEWRASLISGRLAKKALAIEPFRLPGK